MMYERSKEMRRTILKLLDRPKSAYDIAKEITKNEKNILLNDFINVNTKVRYHLNKMVKEGILKRKKTKADTPFGFKYVYWKIGGEYNDNGCDEV